MILNLWKARNVEQAQAEALYRAAVRQTRRPEFYEAGGIADSFEARFDLLVLHMALVLRRLKSGGAAEKALAQKLLDLFFADMDAALRELGVGDMSVGKRVRQMSEAFYGRLQAYDDGLADRDGDTLRQAVARNLYGGEAESLDGASIIAGYMRQISEHLRQAELEQLVSGPAFPEPPEFPKPGPAGRKV